MITTETILSQEEIHPHRVSRGGNKQRRKNKSFFRVKSTATTATILSSLSLLLLWGQYPLPAHGWGGGGSVDTTVYGDSLSRDWLSDGSTISLKVEGCMWGVTENNEDMGCMEDGSNDGTEYWYQMANCRRAQVVYNLYTGSGCGNFKESFVTQNGLAEFVYYLQKYNNGYNLNGNDDGNNNNDDGNQGYNDFDDLPLCEQANNGNYVGLGCNDDGTFAMMYFADKYCLTPTGDVYDKLRSLNRQLRTYKSCATIFKSGGYDNNGYTLPAVLIRNSDSCSSLETSLCTDSSSMKSRRSHTSRSASRSSALNMQSLSQKSWVTKLKYVTAGILLLASFVMFTGILFTNRRRRRALMQRKYRQSKSRKGKSKSGRSSRSKSKSKDGRASTKSPSRRSSKAPRSRDDDEDEDDGEGGVFS